MKRVSFGIAKCLKEAGYPQEYSKAYYDAYGEIIELYPKKDIEYFVAPTYLETWLWLWRAKEWFLKIIPSKKGEFHFQILQYDKEYEDWHSYGVASHSCFHDPEEAIIAAIEYLVDNDLIK